MSQKPVNNELATWRIFRKSGAYSAFIGIVEAVDKEIAIENAIKHFKITDTDQQKRLVAERRK